MRDSSKIVSATVLMLFGSFVMSASDLFKNDLMFGLGFILLMIGGTLGLYCGLRIANKEDGKYAA